MKVSFHSKRPNHLEQELKACCQPGAQTRRATEQWHSPKKSHQCSASETWQRDLSVSTASPNEVLSVVQISRFFSCVDDKSKALFCARQGNFQLVLAWDPAEVTKCTICFTSRLLSKSDYSNEDHRITNNRKAVRKRCNNSSRILCHWPLQWRIRQQIKKCIKRIPVSDVLSHPWKGRDIICISQICWE